MIKVALVDQHPVVCDAMESLLKDADDIEIKCCNRSIADLSELLSKELIHVVIAVFYSPDSHNVSDIKLLMQRYPKIKVLVLSMFRDEKFILQIIKAGIKGHLGPDTNRSEILEAIYTLRNGYEFYAKTITNILLNSYLTDQDIDKQEKENRQKELSAREMEVLKLFAEGMSNRDIAFQLFISVRTVETHKNNIMKKINLKTTVDLVKFAIKNNITGLD